MKKNIVIFFLLLGFFLLGIFAQQALALDAGLSYGRGTGLPAQDIRLVIAGMINTFIGVLAIIFLIIIVISGAFYMISKEDPEKKAKIKKIMISATIGMVIIVSALSIVSFILKSLAVNSEADQETGLSGYISGDADGNNQITSADLLILRSAIQGNNIRCYDRARQEINCQQVLDMDGDGLLGPGDYSVLQSLLLRQ